MIRFRRVGFAFDITLTMVRYRLHHLIAPTPRLGGGMGTQRSTLDSCSPAQIARAIVKVNKTPELRRAGLSAMWKLYYSPQHSLARAEFEKEFGLLEDHFGLYSCGVAEQLGIDNPDALALVNSSQNDDGIEMLTLKPSVVSAIRYHAFSK
jgi:hypothetical protein